jgi:hypothetical protein
MRLTALTTNEWFAKALAEHHWQALLDHIQYVGWEPKNTPLEIAVVLWALQEGHRIGRQNGIREVTRSIGDTLSQWEGELF